MSTVIKANGDREDFSEDKVIRSIKRAGIPIELQPKVLEHVKQRLYEDIPTSEIFHHITEFLGSSDHPYTSSRYGLKQAIMQLGPTGYPFEDYVSALLMHQGYLTKVRQFLMGTCVNHEIDVIAHQHDIHAMIEVKFHNNPGIRSDVHVSMYTKARFDDVKAKHNLNEVWLVTNTKATIDAIAYAQCVGMRVISWSYPEGKSLRDMVEAAKLHPITILTTLSSAQKITLLENHIVTCKDISRNPDVLDALNLDADTTREILREVNFISNQEIHL